MSYVPIFSFPGGNEIQAPTENVTFKWVSSLGGSILPGPVTQGTLNPADVPTRCGIATAASDGHITIEYHYAGTMLAAPVFGINSYDDSLGS